MSSRQENPLLAALTQDQLSAVGSRQMPAGVSDGSSPRSWHLAAKMPRCLQPLCLPLEKLRLVRDHMLLAMEQGLSCSTQGQATLPMLPAFTRSTPDGTESGDFLVLELRDEPCVRVLLMELRGAGHRPAMRERRFQVPEALTRGPGEELFSFMATCLCEFLDGLGTPQTAFQLGFSFPFACRQTQLHQSYLLSWSKGFACSGVEGQDVVQLLQNAINEQDVKGAPGEGLAVHH
ncbi:hexokinase-3-like [Carettochelys insculpta]|uniref:hexokinase-3-like n=1 Tax=Carettochelys insculpta TaxID=44489 RepID=UPI003EC0E043